MGDQFLALSEGRSQAPDGERHIGLVVDDRPGTLAAAREAGAEMIGDNDFRDPWGNHFQVVAYSRHPVHEDRPDPRGDGARRAREVGAGARRAPREGPCGLASRRSGSHSLSPQPPRPRRPGRSSRSRQKRALCRTFLASRGGRSTRSRTTAQAAGSSAASSRRSAASPAGTSSTSAQTAPSTPASARGRTGSVRALARVGGTLYVGGGARSEARVARALRPRDRARSGHGAPAPGRARASSTSRPAAASCTSPASSRRIGGKARRNLAAISLANGRATRFAPNPDEDVHGDSAVATVVAAGSVYVWGIFSRIGGLPRDSFARPRPGHRPRPPDVRVADLPHRPARRTGRRCCAGTSLGCEASKGPLRALSLPT